MKNDHITIDLPATGFVRQSELLKLIPISSATLWRMAKAGTFPRPSKLSQRVTAWRVEDIREWMNATSARSITP